VIAEDLPAPPRLAASSEAEEWFGYAPDHRGCDELSSGSGATRPHWQGLLDSLAHLGLPELTRRWQDAQQIIRENGVTYNMYDDSRGLERPWQLDPLPLLISSHDAQRLHHGLVQRARLLEVLGRDLYGPQQCLKAGQLPPELLFANPAFLRACHGVCWPQNRLLHLYAANIGRRLVRRAGRPHAGAVRRRVRA
jgi:uncharacterized circularly permuted ATP-grasp superfamily protein